MDAAGLGEAATRWTLAQVRHDDAGPWMPEHVVADGPDEAPADRDCVYVGVAGLAFLLQEVALARPLTDDEAALRDALVVRLVAASASTVEPCLHDGLAGYPSALRALGSSDRSGLARLVASARPDGWATSYDDGGEVYHDVVLGTAGIVLGALDAGGADAAEVVLAGCEALALAAEPAPGGVRWRMTPGHEVDMPNFSHGTAGVAAVLALGGAALDRPDWVSLAVAGVEHLLTLADLDDGLFRLPMRIPYKEGYEQYAHGWCHGGTGTSYLFPALSRAGVEQVGGYAVRELRDRSVDSVLRSGVPERLHPGFWDNDGLCCGTAGAGMMLLDSAQDADDPARAQELLAGARRMGEALAERALVDDDGALWRFTEHRAEEPLLPPSPTWMQGSAGIAAFLLRLGRVQAQGLDAAVARRPETWWAVPDRLLVG